jgi:hydrogenase maturation protein HypF
LIHNRDIYTRYDDSVAMVEVNRPQLMRRARGYAPYPIHLPFQTRQTLACGPELKNTFCLTRDNHAFISQHIGDMENLETLEHFEKTVDLYKRLFRIEPEIVAYDLHPDYLTTKYARQLGNADAKLQLVGVQHHHAHIVSCMVENNVLEPVIGVALDGTGYGTDGTVWGGEFLVADYHGFQRVGHLQYVPLPGGAAAIERPYRMALSYLLTLTDHEVLEKDLPLFSFTSKEEIVMVKTQIERKLNSPLTSSCGRLFDGVSALIGVRGEIDYEGQAAIEMEMLATDIKEHGGYPFSIMEKDGVRQVYLTELFSSIISDLEAGTPKANIAARFHNTIALLIQNMCLLISKDTGLKKVALSGGVFQNRLLLRLTYAALKDTGFTILIHEKVPTNDGCISLGQAVVANCSVG